MSTPKEMHPDAVARRRNPLIEDNQADTLYNVACVASFLARHQIDRSDALFMEEKGGVRGPDPLNAIESRGLGLITEALAAALWFELEGRQGAEGGQT